MARGIAAARRLLAALSLSCAAGMLAGCAADSAFVEAEVRRDAIDLMSEGERLEQQGEYILALEKYAAALDFSPRPALYYRAGRVNRLLGRPERAAWYFDRALEMQPDYPVAEAERELLRLEMIEDDIAGDAGLRIAEAPSAPEIGDQPSVQTDPSPADRDASASAFPLESLDPAEVRDALFPELARDAAADPAAIRTQAAAASEEGQWLAAIRLWSRLAALDPADVAARLELAHAYRKTGRTRRAMEEFARLAEIAPGNPEVWLRWGNAFAAAGEEARAESCYLRAVDAAPDDPRVRNNLGAVYLNRGDFQRAAAQFEAAVAAQPDLAAAHLNLALALDGSGTDPQRAIREVEEYLRLGGDRRREAEKWLVELRGRAPTP